MIGLIEQSGDIPGNSIQSRPQPKMLTQTDAILYSCSSMTSRPTSSSGTSSRGGTAATAHPTPHNRSHHHSTASNHPQSTSRSTSKTRVPPPQAPKASRRGTDSSTTTTSSSSSSRQSNPVFNLGPPQALVPRASCGKPDDILAPPDAQSCPLAKAGLKMTGSANGPYGELDQLVDFISQSQCIA
jgi:hypothetical protein